VSYELLQFNLGTGQAKGYVLHGVGEHDGTNVSLSAESMANLIAAEEFRLRNFEGWHSPAPVGFMMPSEDERAVRENQMKRLHQAVAAGLDSLFLRRHAERMLDASRAPESEYHRNGASE
jgi:hypothetical protein